MNTPVNFKLAKLLKEKGFDESCDNWSYLNEDCMAMQYDPKTCVKIPTISDTVMWIYKKHGIWIGVQPTSVVGKFQFRTYYNNKGVMNQHWNDTMSKEFKSPEEAYEAGIKFIVKAI